MWDFLTNFFTDWTLSTVFARVGIVLLFTLVFYALFYYAKKSNMQTLIIFAVLAVLFVFALSFAQDGSYVPCVYHVRNHLPCGRIAV